MTNEEAIKAIEVIRNYILKDPSWLKSFTDKANEAVDMAINALKAQEQLSNDSPELDKKNGELISNKRTQERTETHACDLISRQDAIDALEKVAELYPWRVPGDRDSYSKYNEAWNDALDRAESEIEALPSAQPEIIRCKDCKYNSNTCGNYVNCDIIPQMFGRTVDNFCSMAERRTDG